MNIKPILKSSVTHYLIGATAGVGISYIYDRWRASKIIVVPAATPAEAAIIREREPFVIDADELAKLNSVLDEEVLVARRDHEIEVDQGARELMGLRTPKTDPQTVVVNVFNNQNSTWDYEAELSARDPELPYIISYDEYDLEEMGYRQDTVTYYAKDGMMADSTDTPLYNYSDLMGHLRFGHGSNDPNVVYIRNEKLHMEWEVLLHTSSFAEEVLGQQMEQQTENELRHSVLRFRGD